MEIKESFPSQQNLVEKLNAKKIDLTSIWMVAAELLRGLTSDGLRVALVGTMPPLP